MHPKNLDHTKCETINLTEKAEKREIPKGREGGIVVSSLLCFHIISTLLRALRPRKYSVIFQTQMFRYINACSKTIYKTMLQQNSQKFLRRLTRDGEGPDL